MMAIFPSRKSRRRRKSATWQDGFTLFELVIVLLVLCGTWYALAERLLYYRGEAEKAEVKWVLAALRATLRGQEGVFYLSGQPERIGSLVGSNPMAMLGQRPRNYLGEFDSPVPEKLPYGIWYFDRGNRTLVYLLNNQKYFADGHPKMLKFKVESSRKPSVNIHGRPAGHAGVALEQFKN